MLIVCPNCATSYRVEPTSLGAAGRPVRCVRCRNVWFASNAAANPAMPWAGPAEAETIAADGFVADPSPPAPQGADPVICSIDEDRARAEPEALAEMASAAPLAAAQASSLAAPWPHVLPAALEPSAVVDQPALEQAEPCEPLPAHVMPGEDIESVAARRIPRRGGRPFRWPQSGAPAAILALVALNAALIGWRADVVSAAPQTASLYAAIGLPVNLRGLSIANVTTAVETHDGIQVLVTEGLIASAAARAVEVPRLRFSVRNAAGQEVYAWTALPGRSVLAPGESLPFRSRLASPPPDARDLLVRFYNRRDLMAGLQ